MRVDQSAVVRDYTNSGLSWKGKVIRVADAFLPKRTNGPNELALAAFMLARLVGMLARVRGGGWAVAGAVRSSSI